MFPVYFTVWKLLVSPPHCVNVRVLGLAVTPPLGSLLPRANEKVAGLLGLTSQPACPVSATQYLTVTPVSSFWVIDWLLWAPAVRLSSSESAKAAIAGTAISTATTIKRSVALPLSIVRISRDPPSRCKYTSRSLSPFLSLSPLHLGGEFHFSVGVFPIRSRRLPRRGRHALCHAANLIYAMWTFFSRFPAQGTLRSIGHPPATGLAHSGVRITEGVAANAGAKG